MERAIVLVGGVGYGTSAAAVVFLVIESAGGMVRLGRKSEEGGWTY